MRVDERPERAGRPGRQWLVARRARLEQRARRAIAAALHAGWAWAGQYGAVGPDHPWAKRFGAFGEGSVLCFPPGTVYNERYIRIGRGTMVGPYVTLSAGIAPGQRMLTDPVVRIGDRVVLGRGSHVVGHLAIEIGDDVQTGPYCYVTDQNHGYEDLGEPIGTQRPTEAPVSIGAGSWLGAGVVVLPGARIGRHVVVGAGSVVTGELPDNCVAVGAPARVVRAYHDGEGWRPRRRAVGSWWLQAGEGGADG
ncbi:DapH/DapD/GlmU-related protein [Aciditerrimonas ferrireducens]|jgi:acetyltransferase-like isoleucine patch superfamily enzyme|uniref:DapH/DapD/GlmU-related protein n=1 Tax=Aciditerrimonas ferrireducens TaxID=667306 RepID=A0ABV6C1Z7_9ACTN